MAPPKKTNCKKPEHAAPTQTQPVVPPELVIKSPLDQNDYLVIQLPNGLKAFLVSKIGHSSALTLKEPKVNKKTGVLLEVEEFNRKFVHIPDEDETTCPNSDDESDSEDEDNDWEPVRKKAKVELEKTTRGLGFGSVCLSVGAGWLHDPPDFQGLAHLCEHSCVSFGSKRYPEENTFGKKVESCRFGYWNAETHPEFTSYYFEIPLKDGGLDNFKATLDILADLVNDPLLPADAVNQEVYAIDSEMSLWGGLIYAQFWQLFSGTAKKSHPCHEFSFGSQETLGKPTLHSRLVEWKNRHYAANYSTLAISAHLPLEDLEQMVRQYFGQIRSSVMISPMAEIVLKYKGNPFDTPEFSKLYKILPTLDYQIAVFTWVVPSPKHINDFERKPCLFLRYLFDGDSPFMKFLDNKGWAYDLLVYYGSQIGHRSFCSTFRIYIQLTDLGVKEFDEVIKSLFSYLKSIVKLRVGAKEDIFNAIRREKADWFHYVPRHFALDDLVRATSLLFRLKDPKYMLTAEKLVTRFDPEFLQEFIEQLTPRNVNIMISSKSFESECDQIEQYLKTKYNVSELQEKFLRECETVKIYKEFEFPTDKRYENPLRTKNIICPVQNLFGVQTLRDDDKGVVDFLKVNWCRTGTVPNGYYYTVIDSRMIPKSETSDILLSIWTAMFQVVLRKSFALCWKARILPGLSPRESGGQSIFMLLIGPTFHFAKLFKLYISTFLGLDKFVNEKMFEDYKQIHVKGYDVGSTDPLSLAWDLENVVFRQKAAIVLQRKVAASNLDFQDFKNFVSAFKGRMKFYVSLVGCISDRDALDVTNFVDGLEFRGMPEDAFGHMPPCRSIQLPFGEKCLRVKARSDLVYISVVKNFYQIGIVNFFQYLLVETLCEIMRFPVFDQLRTTEQLSYYVRIFTDFYCGSLALEFVVIPQPHRHTTGYVDQQISSFLTNFRALFGSLKSLKAEGVWPAWLGDEWHQTLLQIYDDFLLPTGKNFRKISVQIVGTKKYLESVPVDVEAAELNKKIDENSSKSCEREGGQSRNSKLKLDYDIPDNVRCKNGYFITNLEAFKDSLLLNPHMDCEKNFD